MFTGDVYFDVVGPARTSPAGGFAPSGSAPAPAPCGTATAWAKRPTSPKASPSPATHDLPVKENFRCPPEWPAYVCEGWTR